MIKINPLVFQFLNNYQNDIQKMNYEAWAKFMAKVNEKNNYLKQTEEYLKVLNMLFPI